MAFTYNAATGAPRDQVRLRIADTDTATAANQMFDDDEIDLFLSMESNNVYGAAAAAFESLSASTAPAAIVSRAAEMYQIDAKAVPAHFRALAKMFRERAAESGAAITETVDMLDYVVSPFGVDRSEYVGDPGTS